MYFNEDQSGCLEDCVRRIKQQTGVKLTVALVDRAGGYPEIPWKAFAFGICVHALVHLLQSILYPDSVLRWGLQHTLGFIIGTSAAIALLTQLWPSFGTIFLAKSHAETTTRRYAESMFARHAIFNTPERNGVLMLVSIFERQVAIVPDTGIAVHFDRRARQQVIDAMAPLLRRYDYFAAFEKGLQTFEAVLPATATEQPSAFEDGAVQGGFLQLKGLDS
jgi:uncharacterized membrane protein